MGKNMINGAHSVIYSRDPEADRAFFRDILGLPNVDVGEGWLIFGLPPSEVAVHPSEKNDSHELYLMCDDIKALVSTMTEQHIACAPVQDEGWGLAYAYYIARRRTTRYLPAATRTTRKSAMTDKH